MSSARLRTRCGLVRKRGSVAKFVAAQQGAKRLVEAVVASGDDDVAVARLKRLVGDDVRIGVAVARGLLAGDQVVGETLPKQRDG